MPSPAPAPQVGDASPRLPPSSTRPSLPTVRVPAPWPAGRGSTTSSWIRAPWLTTRSDTGGRPAALAGAGKIADQHDDPGDDQAPEPRHHHAHQQPGPQPSRSPTSSQQQLRCMIQDLLTEGAKTGGVRDDGWRKSPSSSATFSPVRSPRTVAAGSSFVVLSMVMTPPLLIIELQSAGTSLRAFPLRHPRPRASVRHRSLVPRLTPAASSTLESA